MNWVSCHFYVGKMQSTLSVVLCVKIESVNMSLFRSLTFPFGIEGEYYPEVWCQYPKCSGFQNVETHRFDKIPELQRQSPLPAMLIGGDIFMGCHSTNGVTYWLHPGWWYTYPSEKYEFVSWDDDIPIIWKVIKVRFQTTNQVIFLPGCWLSQPASDFITAKGPTKPAGLGRHQGTCHTNSGAAASSPDPPEFSMELLFYLSGIYYIYII